MKDLQILSTFQELSGESARRGPSGALVFDACHVGVALRAVLFVEAVLGVSSMFGASAFPEWLTRMSVLTGAALPGTLVWLITACALKNALASLRPWFQQMSGILLGAVAGMCGCAMLSLAGWPDSMPWFASACAGALLAGILVQALLWRQRSRAPAQTRARLNELQARIRPHFLFNTLNSAIALVRAEPAKAESLLEDLSDLFRHALAEQGDYVTLAEEIALAQRYLAIERVRFGARIQLEWSLDDAAGAAKLPPLLLQPLVENAVRHGVEPSAGGAQIRISTQRRGSRVVIKVTNTVPAGQGESGSRLALDNVRERLSLLHDVQCKFQAVEREGIFQVRIEVPA